MVATNISKQLRYINIMASNMIYKWYLFSEIINHLFNVRPLHKSQDAYCRPQKKIELTMNHNTDTFNKMSLNVLAKSGNSCSAIKLLSSARQPKSDPGHWQSEYQSRPLWHKRQTLQSRHIYVKINRHHCVGLGQSQQIRPIPSENWRHLT